MDPIYLRRRPPMTRDRFWVLVSQNIGMGLCLGYVLLGTINTVATVIQNFAIIFAGYGQ